MHAAGLHPLMGTGVSVKYAGIANSPVRTAFKDARWRVTKGKRWGGACMGGVRVRDEG